MTLGFLNGEELAIIKEMCDEKRETLKLAEKKDARVEDYTDELRDAVRNCDDVESLATVLGMIFCYVRDEDDEKLMFDALAVFIASVMEG